jgi:pyruvate/2-oxoglutarate dehydrogenase complex dihydrolipoamide acyltransferase (E2) component
MRKEVIMPKVGLDMEEGAIQSWLIKVGDHVEKGDPLMEIETDKAVTEIESSVSGTLVEIVVEEGEFVEIGTVIAWIEVNG